MGKLSDPPIGVAALVAVPLSRPGRDGSLPFAEVVKHFPVRLHPVADWAQFNSLFRRPGNSSRSPMIYRRKKADQSLHSGQILRIFPVFSLLLGNLR